MSSSAGRWLFGIAGIYDFAIGLVFLLAGPQLFAANGITAPNHWAYIQFASLMLIIFGCMFFAVAHDIRANRNLIPFGMLLKISYSGLAGYYWATTGIPTLFKPFAIIDIVMLVLFVVAYRTTIGPAKTHISASAGAAA